MANEDPEPLGQGATPPSLEARVGWLGIAFASLYLGSVYIKLPAVRPGITFGDVIDIATPLVLVVLFARVVRALDPALAVREKAGLPRMPATACFLLLLGAFALVLGHGMHAAANSIHDAIVRVGTFDPFGLINWWDERVSHVAIDSSKLMMCVGLTALEGGWAAGGVRAGDASEAPGAGGILALGAAAYGFIYFAAGVEGQTVALLLPFSVIYLLWSLKRGRPFPPVRRFYTLGALVSILLFAVWGIWHRGFPEFSSVGLIP